MISNFIFTYGDIFEHPITFVNVDLPDQPLIYVNQAFQNLTQYPKSEIVGQNCRFLQGPGTDPEATQLIRKAINNHLPLCQDLLNFKKGGEKFCNRLVLTPFKELNVQYYLGLQHEISPNISRTHHDIRSDVLKSEFQDPVSGLVKDAYLANQRGKKVSVEDLKLRFRSTLENIESFILKL